MSRPTWSVPSQAVQPSPSDHPGGWSRARISCASGSRGASQPAPTAETITTTTRAAPSSVRRWRPIQRRLAMRGARQVTAGTTTALGKAGARAAGYPSPSAVMDARIEQPVADVHGPVDEHEGQTEQEHDRLDDRIVALGDCLHRELPHAGPREDRLGHHRAAEERADLEAEDGHDGNQRVLQRVPE